MKRRSDLGALAVVSVLILLAFTARYLTAQTLPLPNGVATVVNVGAGGGPSLFANGTLAAPSVAFASSPGTGWLYRTNGAWDFSAGGTRTFVVFSGGASMNSSAVLGWSPSDPGTAGADVGLGRAAASLAQANNGASGQTSSLALNRLIATGSSPNCIDNCGSAGAAIVVGTDFGWRITLGTVATQNTFAIGFRTAYTGAPNCQAQRVGAGTATVSSTNSTATGVTVNLTSAPANSTVFQGICVGQTLG